MKKITLSTLFILTIITVSCKKDNPYEKYEGSWSGTYSGEDTGTWTTNVDEEGNVNGTAVSDSLPDFPFDLTGTITEEGHFEAQASVFIGTIDFEGQLTGSSASGVWSNNEAGIEGTWTGEKN